jgi:RimJ/RimL family protein N-acetyltransferase
MFTIRPLVLNDATGVYAAVDRSRPELARWMVWYQPGYAAADAAEWVQRSCAQHEARTAYHFAICDDLGALVGAISLEDVDARTGMALLGYWVATPAAGRGAAAEAIRQVLDWASSETSIRRVWALIARDNHASRRVAEANGLRPVARVGRSDSTEQMRYEVDLQRGSEPLE